VDLDAKMPKNAIFLKTKQFRAMVSVTKNGRKNQNYIIYVT